MPKAQSPDPSSPRKKPSSRSKQSTSPKRNSVASPRARRSGQHPTDAEKAQIKQRFISAFATSANVLRAAEKAGIPTKTAYEWQKTDAWFAADWENAERDATSLLYEEARRRAYEGVIKPVVSAGRLVYEELPNLDDSGDPVLDKHGNPEYKRGNPIFVREYSDTLMKMLLVAHDPKKFSERQRLEVTGKDGSKLVLTITLPQAQQMAKEAEDEVGAYRKKRGLPAPNSEEHLG